MADLVVTDLTFTVTRVLRRQGGTRPFREVLGTILIPGGGALTYPTGGVPVSGVTNSATGAIVVANGLACPGLACPNELVSLAILANGNAAGLDDALTLGFDLGAAGTRPHKLRVLVAPTPSGTVAAPVFTGSALAAHRHTLHFQTAAAANAVTAAANQLRTAAAAFDVAGVADSAGEGGVVDVTGGTPAGTNSAPAFTGTATARLAEHGNVAIAEALTVYVLAVGF